MIRATLVNASASPWTLLTLPPCHHSQTITAALPRKKPQTATAVSHQPLRAASRDAREGARERVSTPTPTSDTYEACLANMNLSWVHSEKSL